MATLASPFFLSDSGYFLEFKYIYIYIFIYYYHHLTFKVLEDLRYSSQVNVLGSLK